MIRRPSASIFHSRLRPFLMSFITELIPNIRLIEDEVGTISDTVNGPGRTEKKRRFYPAYPSFFKVGITLQIALSVCTYVHPSVITLDGP